MSSGALTRILARGLDRLVRLLRRGSGEPAHLAVGRAGEDEAYFFLRQYGYTVVARNWRTPRAKGELDFVAWDESVLCFVEVKTRTRRAFVPAEAAVDREKMRELALMAKLYLRKVAPGTPYRFDVVSVYFVEGKAPVVELFKDAFGWKTRR